MGAISDLVTNQKKLIQTFENEAGLLEGNIKKADTQIENKIKEMPTTSLLEISKKNERPFMFIMGKHSNYWNEWLSTGRNWWDDGRQYLDGLVRDPEGKGIRWETQPTLINSGFRIGFQYDNDSYAGNGGDNGEGFIGVMFIENPTEKEVQIPLSTYLSSRTSSWGSTAFWVVTPNKNNSQIKNGEKVESLTSSRVYLRQDNNVTGDQKFTVTIPAYTTIALVWKIGAYYWTNWNGYWSELNFRFDDLRPIYNANCKVDVDRTFNAFYGLNDAKSIEQIWN